MRVFLTGATGFIGSAIVSELKAAGHEVLGLARNDAAADKLTRWGVAVHRGDVTEPEGLAAAARACDGVIHCAFIHDFTQFEQNGLIDVAAVKAMASALEGTGKPLVVTSGTLLAALMAPGQEANEAILTPDGAPGRAGSEVLARTMAERGVRTSIVRLAPSVHGVSPDGPRAGFGSVLIETARQRGVAAYVGDGANRWPAVHRLDAARLFRLALEKATPVQRLHGVAESVTTRAIAETIGAGLGVPVRSIAPAAAAEHFGFLGAFASLDNPTSNATTCETLGWRPDGPDLLTDLSENGYFAQLSTV